MTGALFLVLALTSCGEGTSTAELADHTARGRISGFGDLHVNGVQYSTAGATITIDGQPATLEELEVGMVVTVRGRVNNDSTAGVATAIDYVTTLQGFASEVDPTAGSLTVFGQTVRIDYTTFLKNLNGLGELTQGDVVEVSGFPDNTGSIRATFLSRKKRIDSVAIAGKIIDPPGNNSLILEVTPKGRHVTVIGPAGVDLKLTAGDFIQVKASSFDLHGTVINSKEIRVLDNLPVARGGQINMEGYITSHGGEHSFTINGFPVNDLGLTPGFSPKEGMKIELSAIMGKGELLAARVDEESASDTRISGEVGSVAPGTFSLQLCGLTVYINERTAFRDDSTLRLRNFGLAGNAGIKAGDYLVISGYSHSDKFHATSVMRK